MNIQIYHEAIWRQKCMKLSSCAYSQWHIAQWVRVFSADGAAESQSPWGYCHAIIPSGLCSLWHLSISLFYMRAWVIGLCTLTCFSWLFLTAISNSWFTFQLKCAKNHYIFTLSVVYFQKLSKVTSGSHFFQILVFCALNCVMWLCAFTLDVSADTSGTVFFIDSFKNVWILW